ncbi:helix-turn-helix domain-containing protein [uncultured Robinsoniella sp.]|uniref:helix-turn-helix domain-containing protein n=1 Tax=uncultured Robinsoniella sp. TaxID=904190 RepID=UPI00374E6DD7
MEIMDETRYMISDAAKKVAVEAHVLRYWEEELELPIARTELGHRYYTEENIRIFQNIKELKERGFQLKAIKVLIPEIAKREIKNTDNIIHLEEKLNRKSLDKDHEADKIPQASASEPEKDKQKEQTAEGMQKPHKEISNENSKDKPHQNGNSQERAVKDGKKETLSDKKDSEKCVADVLETTLSELEFDVDKLLQFEKIVGNIVTTALKENNKELNDQISESVTKEIDYLLKLREEKEEDRYRRLDESIRAHQNQGSKHLVAATQSEDVKPQKKGFFFWRH